MKNRTGTLQVFFTSLSIASVVLMLGCGGANSGSPPPPSAPTVNSISPSSATAGRAGFTLTVNGSNFVNSATVRWNGSDRPTSFVSSTQLTAAIAASDIASSAMIQITVFNPAPHNRVSNSISFPIAAPPPVLSSLSPSSVVAGHSPFNLTVDGSGFLPDSLVQWNGNSRPTTFVSSARLTAAISAGDVSSPGTAQVRVVNSPQDTSSSLPFTINSLTSNPAPAVASLFPATAPVGWPGFPLTVHGFNFIASTTLQWNGLNRPTTVFSNTRLVARIPLGDLATAGTAQVSAFTPSPGGGVSSALSFATFAVAAGAVGVIDRSSIATDLTEADDHSFSFSPAISADGRYVAFTSHASNLVSGDTNGFNDIFVRDTCVGTAAGCTPSTVRVSVGTNGEQATESSFSVAISADGRYVAFASDATNLVPGDTNGFADIFIRDTCVGATAGCTPSTTRVSLDSQGNQLQLPSVSLAISSNGRYLAFARGFFDYYYSSGSVDVFVRDTCNGVSTGCLASTVLVSVDTDGLPSGNFEGPLAISADGRYVAFASFAPNLVASDTNGSADVFVRDTCVGATAGCTPSTVLVSVGTSGEQANSSSFSPAISADGRYLAFFSNATNLAPGDTNDHGDIFLSRTALRARTRVFLVRRRRNARRVQRP